MSIITNAMKSITKFKMIDVIIFKFYLLLVGFFLANLIPWVLSLNVLWYAIISILAIIYFLILFFKKWEKKVWFFKLGLDRFQKFSMFQVWLYKVTIVIFALLLAKTFPELMNIDVAWYAAWVWFGAGYFIKMIWVK